MAEVHAVRDMWEDEVGRVSRVNLPSPDVVMGKYGPAERLYCGIYFRYYDREAKEHKFCLSLVKAKDLHVTRDRPTNHLATLQIARATLDNPKVSYCIGFFVEDGVIKRNSCSNEKYYGDRGLPDRIYGQLVDILKTHFSTKVRRDDGNDPQPVAQHKPQPPPPAPVATHKRLVLTEEPRWPALTKKGEDCSKCVDKGEGVFCHLHEDAAATAADSDCTCAPPSPVSRPRKEKKVGKAAVPTTPPRKPKAPAAAVDPPAAAAAARSRRWPALTKKGEDCKDCTKKGKGSFCHRHDGTD